MRKYLFAVLAALAAGVSLAFTPVAHTNSYVRDGVTYVQRGGLGTADYVVTNVTMPTITYPVTSVNGKTGEVSLVATDVGAVASQVTSGDVGVRLVQTANSLTLNKIDKEGDEWVLSPNKKLTLRPQLLVVEGDCAVGIDTESAVLGFSDSTASFIDNDFDGYIGKDVWMTGGHEIYHPYSPYGTQNQKIALKGDLSSYVPTGRKVNEKSLAQDITLYASDVQALPNNYSSLTNNTNFKNAVATVSPPIVLPTKWALANVTNSTGGAVTAADVGAVSLSGDSSISGNLTANSMTALAADNSTKYGASTIYRNYQRGEDATINLPNASGTLALTSQIPSVPSKWAFANVTNASGSAVSASDVGARASDWMPTAAQVGALPDSTTHLSGDVPTSRTVNNKALSADITLTAVDVNARPSSWTPSATDVGAIAKSGTTQIDIPLYLNDSDGGATRYTFGYDSFIIRDSDANTLTIDSLGITSKYGQNRWSKNWRDFAVLSDFDAYPTSGSSRGVKSGGVRDWVYSNFVANATLNNYLKKNEASTTYETIQNSNTKTGAVRQYAESVSNRFETALTSYAKRDDYRSRIDMNVYRYNLVEQSGVSGNYELGVESFESCITVYLDGDGVAKTAEYATRQMALDALKDGKPFTVAVCVGEWEDVPTGTQFSVINTGATLATSADLGGYVPTSRTINGQPLTQDITIEGMTDNAVVWTNSTLKTKAGATVNAMDYQAMTNTVNAVKAEFYDEPLQVNWTVRMVNGEMKLYATTNVNMSTL